MTERKSMKEQLEARFQAELDQLRAEERSKAGAGRPSTSGGPRKRQVNRRALDARIRRPETPAPEPPPQVVRPRRQAPAAPPPPPRPQAVPPTHWVPPHEEIQLVDAFQPTGGDWVIAPVTGRRTATPTTSVFRAFSKRPIVQVGLDFGTSSTKVMWYRTDVADHMPRTADFGHGLQGYPAYALPSLASFDARGTLLIGDGAVSSLPPDRLPFALSRFKMLVAGDADATYRDAHTRTLFAEHVRQALGDEERCTPEMLTVVFLAFAMRRVRRHIEQVLARSDIEANFNTCVPVDQRENNAVYTAFQRIVGAAQRLEAKAKDGESARAWLERAGEALALGEVPPEERRLHLVPEAVAGTAAYVGSLRRESGIHALVDIGSGTTDVSIFNLTLSQERGATSSWYAARSAPKGMGLVELRLRHELRQRGHAGDADEVREILRGRFTKLPEAATVLREMLETIRVKEANEVWATAYRDKYRIESAWRGKRVRVFLAGGGALIPLAREVFARSWVSDWGPYPCEIIPDPENYVEAKVGAPFVRVSVAYGLTTPIPQLEEFIMPKDAPNDTPPPAPRREWVQDGDQLLPRAGW